MKYTIFTFKESEDYDQKRYGFAESPNEVDPIDIYQGSPLEKPWKEPIAPFVCVLVNKLVNSSFEEAFAQSYDSFSCIFEYLIKGYNTARGNKYAEYNTPYAIDTTLIYVWKLGQEYKDSTGLKKVRLDDDEIKKIISTFQRKEATDDFLLPLPTTRSGKKDILYLPSNISTSKLIISILQPSLMLVWQIANKRFPSNLQRATG